MSGATDHSADAGGDRALLDAKRSLREEIWTDMAEAGIARFPGARNRIPNFDGAKEAAERLRATPAWSDARLLKANPDSPQWPVRERALADGIVVAMAVPRLAEPDPFFLLDPASLAVPPRQASSIKGASRHGRSVAIAELDPFDLVVTGCVAVDRTGARLGKGGGFADLEFALTAAAGLIDDETLLVTTVHERQVLAADRIPMDAHDTPLDLIVTPEQVIDCRRWGRRRSQPELRWGLLTDDKIAAIPLLQHLATQPEAR